MNAIRHRPLLRLPRRRWLGLSAAAALTLCVGPLWAGSYLNRAAFLLDEARRAGALLRKHLYDEDYARLAHALAESRLRAAGNMDVPKEVQLAHPHLLLTLEKHERAANAAVERKAQEFMVFSAKARDEAEIFIAILKQLGWTLPEVKL